MFTSHGSLTWAVAAKLIITIITNGLLNGFTLNTVADLGFSRKGVNNLGEGLCNALAKFP